MTYLTWKYSGFSPNKIIGSGTCLDTARLRFLIGNKLGVNPKNIHAYVVGEHGDSEFVPWSNANIGLQKISTFLDEDDLNTIHKSVKNAAYDIIDRKGATYYGIGMSLVKITNAILGDENAILTVSNYDKDNNIFMGTPAVINRNGIKRRIYIELNEKETNKLQNCVDIIKSAIDKIE